MDNLILPISINPPYCTYHEQAFPLGIMEANGINVKEWLCNESLVLRSPCWDTIQAQCIDKISFIEYGPIISESFDIFPSDLYNNPQFIINRITELLRTGYYISGYANYKAIPSKDDKRLQEDRVSNIQIYGVDFPEKSFFCIGYNNNISWSYKPYKVKWNHFIDSQRMRNDERFGFTILKFNKKYRYELNKDTTKKFIVDFLHSEYDYSYNVKFKDYKYGINAQHQYIEYLNTIMQNKKRLDLRNSRSLMEFKNVVFYFLKNYIVNADAKDYNYLVGLYDRYRQHHMLCLKYNIQNNCSSLDRNIFNLEQTFVEEQNILEQLI